MSMVSSESLNRFSSITLVAAEMDTPSKKMSDHIIPCPCPRAKGSAFTKSTLEDPSSLTRYSGSSDKEDKDNKDDDNDDDGVAVVLVSSNDEGCDDDDEEDDTREHTIPPRMIKAAKS